MSYSWDPVCGTGLFLIEAIDLIDEKLRLTRLASSELAASRNRSAERLFGVEFNSQVAELAATNLMLNGLPPTQIVTGNSLRSETFEGTSLHGLPQREFDVMALDPPIGGWEEDPRLIWASEIGGNRKSAPGSLADGKGTQAAAARRQTRSACT